MGECGTEPRVGDFEASLAGARLSTQHARERTSQMAGGLAVLLQPVPDPLGEIR